MKRMMISWKKGGGECVVKLDKKRRMRRRRRRRSKKVVKMIGRKLKTKSMTRRETEGEGRDGQQGEKE